MSDQYFWDLNVEEGYYDLNYLNGLKSNRGIRFNWHKFTFEEVKKHLKHNSIHLDYACGPGTFLGNYVMNKSVGFDISQKQINYATRKYSNHEFTSDLTIVKQKAPYDSISVIGLLEFLTDDEITVLINNLKSLMKPDGYIIFTTPNFKFSMKLIQWISSFKNDIDYSKVTINKHTKESFIKSEFINQFNDVKIYKILNIGLFFSIIHNRLGKFFHNLIGRFFNNTFGMLLIIKVKI